MFGPHPSNSNEHRFSLCVSLKLIIPSIVSHLYCVILTNAENKNMPLQDPFCPLKKKKHEKHEKHVSIRDQEIERKTAYKCLLESRNLILTKKFFDSIHLSSEFE